jgi:hypothetical protein
MAAAGITAAYLELGQGPTICIAEFSLDKGGLGFGVWVRIRRFDLHWRWLVAVPQAPECLSAACLYELQGTCNDCMLAGGCTKLGKLRIQLHGQVEGELRQLFH